MNEAAEAELREIRKLWDEMQYIRTGGINALFAHIDAQAAEITDREGKYVDLLRTKHALAAELKTIRTQCDVIGEEHLKDARRLRDMAAEVERLKAHMAECDRQEILRVSSLRDLVREADGIIGDAYDSHYDARLSAADRCAWCKRAAAWRKKAEA